MAPKAKAAKVGKAQAGGKAPKAAPPAPPTLAAAKAVEAMNKAKAEKAAAEKAAAKEAADAAKKAKEEVKAAASAAAAAAAETAKKAEAEAKKAAIIEKGKAAAVALEAAKKSAKEANAAVLALEDDKAKGTNEFGESESKDGSKGSSDDSDDSDSDSDVKVVSGKVPRGHMTKFKVVSAVIPTKGGKCAPLVTANIDDNTLVLSHMQRKLEIPVVTAGSKGATTISEIKKNGAMILRGLHMPGPGQTLIIFMCTALKKFESTSLYKSGVSHDLTGEGKFMTIDLKESEGEQPLLWLPALYEYLVNKRPNISAQYPFVGHYEGLEDTAFMLAELWRQSVDNVSLYCSDARLDTKVGMMELMFHSLIGSGDMLIVGSDANSRKLVYQLVDNVERWLLHKAVKSHDGSARLAKKAKIKDSGSGAGGPAAEREGKGDAVKTLDGKVYNFVVYFCARHPTHIMKKGECPLHGKEHAREQCPQLSSKFPERATKTIERLKLLGYPRGKVPAVGESLESANRA